MLPGNEKHFVFIFFSYFVFRTLYFQFYLNAGIPVISAPVINK